MKWSDIPFTPPTRILRQFAGLWLLFFGGMAGFQLWFRDRPIVAAILALVALAVGFIGLVKPQAIRLVYVGAMIAAFPIGWVVSRLILAILYYGLFTPLGLAFRLVGRDALELKRRTEKTSYWSPKVMRTEPASYLSQY